MERRLYEAAVEGNVNSLLELLQEDKLILDRATIIRLTETPLHVAAMLGHVDFVREILQRKPELARELDSRRFSPLHLASAKGYLDVVKELIRVDTEMCFARDQDGRTPLHLAAIKGRVHVLKELVQIRPQAARVIVDGGETILHLCVKYNQLDALKTLVEIMSGLDDFVNAKDDDGFTVLHDAVADKQVETVNFLIVSTKIEVNALTGDGYTALDILAQSRRDGNDMRLRESLGRVGAIRALDIPSSADNNINIRATRPRVFSRDANNQIIEGIPGGKNEKERKLAWLENQRNTLMVVASLIATMAFQAGVNPPGGVWQDNLKPNAPGGHKAGESIMAYGKPYYYIVFLVSNTIGFTASLSVILLIISGLPFRHRICMWALMAIMWIAITATTASYVYSIIALTPDDCHLVEANGFDMLPHLQHLVTVVSIIWIALMGLLFLGHTIRLIMKIISKFIRSGRWKRGTSSSTTVGEAGV